MRRVADDTAPTVMPTLAAVPAPPNPRVPGFPILRLRHRRTNAAFVHGPVAPAATTLGAPMSGLPIGRAEAAFAQLAPDEPLLATRHGTLECTPVHRVWVYVDHSEHGTRVQGHPRPLHREAVVVRHGDVLEIGELEITIVLEPPQLSKDHGPSSHHPSKDPTTMMTTAATTTKPTVPKLNVPTANPAVEPRLTQRPVSPLLRLRRPVDEAPREYINSPIPGTNWRKKRHSMTAMTMRMPITGILAPAAPTSTPGTHLSNAMTTSPTPTSISAAQSTPPPPQSMPTSCATTHTRPAAFVPSAPSTPPQQNAPRPVNHITHSPQSSYYHVKWREDERPEATEPPKESAKHQRSSHSGGGHIGGSSLGGGGSASAPSSMTSGVRGPTYLMPTPIKPTTPSPSPPPLEYSSSPMTASSFLDRVHQHVHPKHQLKLPSSPPTGGAPRRPDAPTLPFSPTHKETTGTPGRSHRDELRIKVSKKMAGFANTSTTHTGGAGTRGVTNSGAETATPAEASTRRPHSAGTRSTMRKEDESVDVPATTAPTTGTRPSPLARGIQIPTTPTLSSPSSPTTRGALTSGTAKQPRKVLEFTPPASPVAHQDILRQKQSLLNILKSKYKEEQLLKQQQEEWMRLQMQSTTGSGSAPTAPSMSPINMRAANKGIDSAETLTRQKSHGNDKAEDDDEVFQVPARAPALLRTVSLGHQIHNVRQVHQPSPRLTAAVLASRARKGSFDGRSRSNSGGPECSMGYPLSLSQQLLHPSPSHEAAMLRHRTSRDSSVGSSVSTEPANYRRFTRSLSFASSHGGAASSGELSDFLGYDDDTADGLTSFTTHAFFGGPPDDPKRHHRDDSMLGPMQLSFGCKGKRGDGSSGDEGARDEDRTPTRTYHQSRYSELDDEATAVVLRSPAHSRHRGQMSLNIVGAESPESVSASKTQTRTTDRSKPVFRRIHQHLGIDIQQATS